MVSALSFVSGVALIIALVSASALSLTLSLADDLALAFTLAFCFSVCFSCCLRFHSRFEFEFALGLTAFILDTTASPACQPAHICRIYIILGSDDPPSR